MSKNKRKWDESMSGQWRFFLENEKKEKKEKKRLDFS
jgi:hypothetical protein